MKTLEVKYYRKRDAALIQKNKATPSKKYACEYYDNIGIPRVLQNINKARTV